MKQEKKTNIIELDDISLLDFPTFRVNRAKGYTQKSIEIKDLNYKDLLSYTLGLIDCVCLALENNNTEKIDLHSIKTSVKLISHFLPQYEEMDLLDKIALQVLKCTRNTVNNYVDRGYFSVYQPNGKGSKLMYKRAEIEKFLDGANAQGRR